MKSYRKELWFNVPSRRAFLNITSGRNLSARKRGSRGVMSGQRHAYHRQCIYQ
jgi:hypothetical protein